MQLKYDAAHSATEERKKKKNSIFMKIAVSIEVDERKIEIFV